MTLSIDENHHSTHPIFRVSYFSKNSPPQFSSESFLPKTTHSENSIKICNLFQKKKDTIRCLFSFRRGCGARNELQERRRKCRDWEKAPVGLSIAEKRVRLPAPKASPREAFNYADFGRSSISELRKIETKKSKIFTRIPHEKTNLIPKISE